MATGCNLNKPEAGISKQSSETGRDKAKQTGGMSVAEIAGADAASLLGYLAGIKRRLCRFVPRLGCGVLVGGGGHGLGEGSCRRGRVCRLHVWGNCNCNCNKTRWWWGTVRCEWSGSARPGL